MKNVYFLILFFAAVSVSTKAQQISHSIKTGGKQYAINKSENSNTNMALDAGITKHEVPLFIQRNKAVSMSGVMHNYGLNTINAFRVNYSVNGGNVISDAVGNANIVSKQDYHFSSNHNWTPSQNGKYVIKMWLDNLNASVDQNPLNDTIVLNPEVVDSVAVKIPLYEEFKQASCDPCYLACPNMDSVFTKNKKTCNLIEFHTDWPGIDYMNDVTDVPFVNARTAYYNVSGVPDGQLDGTTTSDNFDPSTISTANIAAEAKLGSPFRLGATATFTSATNTYAVKVYVKAYKGTLATMKLKLRCVLTLDTIKYKKDQSDEDPQSAFAPPTGTTKSGGDADKTFKYVTVFPAVAEDMLPDTAGTTLTPFTINTVQTVSLSWVKNHPWGFCPKSNGCIDNGTGGGAAIPSKGPSDSLVSSLYDSVGNNVHITVFVESDSSKYVYQSLTLVPTTNPTGIDELTETQSMELFPNPSRDIVNVNFNLPESQNVNLEVYNLVGQMVYTKDIGKTDAGSHTVSFGVKGFSSGIYLVRLVSDGNSVVKKLVVE